MKKIIVFVLLSFLCFIFCTKNSTTEPENPPVNNAPVITSMTAVPPVLNINMVGQVDSTVVTVIVTDIDDTSLTYTFNAVLGKLRNQNGGEITYTPPAEEGDYFVSCTVSDGISSDIDSVAVQVLQPEPISKIAFIGPGDEIYVINADGSNLPTELTDLYGLSKISSSWSPDGSKIAFCARQLYNYNKDDIYIINLDGSNEIKLTDDGCSLYPSWSPDCSKIIFKSRRDGYNAIYTMDSDGSNQIMIPNSIGGSWPSWSPDGSKIAFESGNQIYIMNSDGTNQVCISNNSFHDGKPSWSPDGSKIAFHSNRFDHISSHYILVMNVDGSNQTKITNGYRPSWSPDGSKIVFQKSDGPTFDHIYIVNSDGSNIIKLTDFIGYCPSWSPFIK